MNVKAFPDFLWDVSPPRKQGVPVAYASRWQFVSHMICKNDLADEPLFGPHGNPGMPDAKPRDRYESWYILTLMFRFMLAPGAVLVFVALYWNRV